MLSSSSRGAPRRAPASISPGSRTSTSSMAASSGAASRTRATAWAIPPAAAMWFSLIRIASNSPTRWLLAPPAATAAFSSVLSPGVVLRVSSTTVPVPSTSRTKRAASVAIPDRRPRKLSAVRSPVSSAPAKPSIESTGPPCSRQTPSCAKRSKRTSGSSSAEHASAASKPKIVPGAFCVISARARASAATVALVVTSPAPTSSAKARPTSSVSSSAAHCMDEADLSR